MQTNKYIIKNNKKLRNFELQFQQKINKNILFGNE